MRGIIIHFRYDTEESAYVDFICNRIGFFCGNYSNSCKMWFHLKLLFEKNMRKAERALAFRISGSKCPFLTYLLLRYSSKSFTNHRSDDHCNDHFAQISRNERNDTDCKCCAYCIAGLEAEPCCSKCVADCSSDDHSEDLDSTVREFVNDNTCDDCHWNKSDDVSAGRTCQFSQSACESGEYRKPYQSEQQVDQVTQSSLFPV